ncbi:MAG: PAS domain-containing protein [Alphaproteobacteria bacterium]
MHLADAPACLAFAEAWERWRGDKLVPTRDDIRPERLGAAMRATTVLHVEAPDRITIRLASVNYELLLGHSAKGINFVELAAPQHRQMRIERHQNMIRTPCGGLARSRVVPPNGLTVMARNLILPVASGPDGPIDFVYNVAHVERPRPLADNGERDIAPLAAEFDYLDIGAGLPR